MGVGMKLPAQNSNAVGIIIICSIWGGTARSLWHEIEIKYEYFIYLCEVIFFLLWRRPITTCPVCLIIYDDIQKWYEWEKMSRNTDFYMRCDDRLIKSEISGAQMWEIPIWVLHLSQTFRRLCWAISSTYLREFELWMLDISNTKNPFNCEARDGTLWVIA